MTQNTPTTVINVSVRSRGGILYASSDDIFGLHIAAKSEDELCARLKVGVKWLYKQNHGVDVEVFVPSDPAQFPQATHKSLEQLVIAAAA
jgi:hypothetical protein